MEKPKEIYRIYDYSKINPDCLERYTFILKGIHRAGYKEYRFILGTSETGLGISMFNELETKFIGRHLGKLVQWENLNSDLQKHIINRLK